MLFRWYMLSIDHLFVSSIPDGFDKRHKTSYHSLCSFIFIFRYYTWKRFCRFKVSSSMFFLRRSKKLTLVAFVYSNIVEIWVHWMYMAVERKYEYHLYPIRGRRHRDSSSCGQVRHCLPTNFYLKIKFVVIFK